MHPIDAIEALYDATALTTGFSEANQVPTPTNHQNRALRLITYAPSDRNLTGPKLIGHSLLKSSRSRYTGQARSE
jgi:hypothetical protein